MVQNFENNKELSSLSRDGNEKCPECSRGRITEDSDTGEMVCLGCGYVAAQKLESQELPVEPHSKPITPGNVDLIDLYGRDSSGKQISPAMRQSLHRLSIYKIVRDPYALRREKSVGMALDRLSAKLNLSQPLKSSVVQLLKDTEQFVKGRPLDVVVAAGIYAIYRENGIPKKITDISDLAGVQSKLLRKVYRIMLRGKLDWNAKEAQSNKYLKMPVQDPVMCVSQIASKCGINETISREAIKIIRDNPELLSGSNPYSIGATALYIACRRHPESARSQIDIAKGSGITSVTIRNNLKKFQVL